MLGDNRRKKGNGVIIQQKMSDTPIALAVGIDAGSTETRVCLADKCDYSVFNDDTRMSDALGVILTTYKIPSTYATIGDARELQSVSESLDDNYDSTLIMLNNGAEKPLMSKHRILRGRKITDTMGLVAMYLDSSTNKTDNIIFYVNIIDSIGYAIMQKYNGAIPKEVAIHLTLSVRPKELSSVCQKKMKDNLVGSFMFNWKGVSIRMNICGVDFTTEPEAQVMGTTVISDLRATCGIDVEENAAMADRLSTPGYFIHIEGGGSSIGVEVLKDGNIIDACSSSFSIGGNYLVQMFIDRYREISGVTVTREAANEAVITCRLRNGRTLLDVADIVAQCKNQVGMDILERLRHQVVDLASDLTLSGVEFITLGGRLFLADECGNTISEYFTQYLHQISEHTETIVLTENFIAPGNVIIGINSDDAKAIMVNSKCGQDVTVEASVVTEVSNYSANNNTTAVSVGVVSDSLSGDEDELDS